MGKKKSASMSPRIVNRQARRDFDILQSLEVGIVLTDSEVKSVRNSQISLAEGFARVEPTSMELMLYNVDIAPYAHSASEGGHERLRPRKLLAHRREIIKLAGLTSNKGLTLVPLALYFVGGRVKIEIGVARGRRQHDKRQDLRQQEADRDIRTAMTRRRI